MAKNLLKMCEEPECGRINVKGRWVGSEYAHYQEEIDNAEAITSRFCPKHRVDNYLIKQLIEWKRSKQLPFIPQYHTK